ncbi:MAG TPA: response regulator [Candidatus Omnitrophota bacterium]|nr:response regulator [Candidatus Omnitrophota bacterium]
MERKILVVDDEPDIVELIEAVLNEHGFEVFTAHNGKDALEVARREKPDLIISDICMPGLSGYEFWKALKDLKLGNAGEIPVLIISAHGDMQSFFDSWGICGFLAKPFNEQELMVKVLEVIGPEAEKKAEMMEKIAKRKKILIRSIQDFSVKKLTSFLESQGHTVMHAYDENETIAVAQKFLPDFVFNQYLEDTPASDSEKILEGLAAITPPQKIEYAVFCLEPLTVEAKKNVPEPHPVFSYVNSEWLIHMVERFIAQQGEKKDVSEEKNK